MEESVSTDKEGRNGSGELKECEVQEYSREAEHVECGGRSKSKSRWEAKKKEVEKDGKGGGLIDWQK